jgi:hypothetical protein
MDNAAEHVLVDVMLTFGLEPDLELSWRDPAFSPRPGQRVPVDEDVGQWKWLSPETASDVGRLLLYGSLKRVEPYEFTPVAGGVEPVMALSAIRGYSKWVDRWMWRVQAPPEVAVVVEILTEMALLALPGFVDLSHRYLLDRDMFSAAHEPAGGSSGV